jgi:hypothetical protein
VTSAIRTFLPSGCQSQDDPGPTVEPDPNPLASDPVPNTQTRLATDIS